MKSGRKVAPRKSGNKIPAQQPVRKTIPIPFEETERRRDEHIRKLKEMQLIEQEVEERRGVVTTNSVNSVRYPYLKPPYRKTQKRKSPDSEVYGQNYCDVGGYENSTPPDQQPCSTSSFTNNSDPFPHLNASDFQIKQEEPYQIKSPIETDQFANQIIKSEDSPVENGLKEVKLEPIQEEDKYAHLFDFLKAPTDSSALEPVNLEERPLPSPSPPPNNIFQMEQLFEDIESNLHVFCQNLKKNAAELSEQNKIICLDRIAYLTKRFRLETSKALVGNKSKIVKGVILDGQDVRKNS